MPAPLTNGQSGRGAAHRHQVNDGAGNKLATLREGVTLRELVDGLNALGVGPRDMIDPAGHQGRRGAAGRSGGAMTTIGVMPTATTQPAQGDVSSGTP